MRGRWGRAVGVVIAVAYAWWATGVAPFTARAYLAVGIPAAALLALAAFAPWLGRTPPPNDARPPGAIGPSRGERSQLRRSLPWLALFLVAAGLEGAGLALGGRSEAVPTVSTVIDHALARHTVRFALFCAWLAAGSIPWRAVLWSWPAGAGER